MGIKDRFLRNSKKEPDQIDNPQTIDIQPSPAGETSSEAEKGFIKQMWNKFRKDSHSDETPKVEAQTEIPADTQPINGGVETENNQKVNKKNKLQSIIQNIFRKDAVISSQSATENTVEEVKPQIVSEQTVKTNPNKLKKLFSQLTQKEKEEIQTEEAIEEVEERLETVSNSSKIKNVFYKLVKSVNPQDIQKYIPKITEKLPSMNRGPIKEIWPKIQSLFQMVVDPTVAWKSKALAIGSLLYLISPFDAIPDIIPIAGLTDDAAVIISVVSTLAIELSKYAKQSASKGIEVAEELADIEVRKYNRIVRITLTGSIIAAILAIAVKIILKHI
ncbi:YkvA family protein [Rivularia sp. UHCC 0363]|uniref:YkvA family protein n=1 Tax=Rivularia sp. UHCC 0363 TaxID=3110244 RepID=UPI002B1F71E8|nr:YkvA family protein [Rivularia sp. UHCC 0363]MEA5596054.1 YkvA family protein [Rivularia sp. UHCC 0363]